MTQATLIPQTPVSVLPSTDDPLIDVIKSFGSRVSHFSEDLTYTISEYVDDTLYDAMQLREAAVELDTIVGILSKRKTELLEKAQEIINDNQAAGKTREGNLEIVSKPSQGKRLVDTVLLKQERPDVYETLVNIEIASIKCSYTPSIAAVKGLLKKQYEHYLKPGEITITYDIAIILPEGEKDD